MALEPVGGSTLPYFTNEIAGIGGHIKQFTEDFIVEELPAYDPSGSGTHVYFRIEKEGLTTLAATKIIAKALGRHPREIGFAGLKDAHAISRQTLSLEHVDPSTVAGLKLGRLKILWVNRHGNKLKLGHLRGNRFQIKVRPEGNRFDRPEDWKERAESVLSTLRRRGVPNYFGEQRFGARGDNGRVGKAVLAGDFAEAMALILGRPNQHDHGPVFKARQLFDEGRLLESASTWPKGFRDQQRLCENLAKSENPRKAWNSLDRGLRSLYLNAFQSELFNAVLIRRLDAIDQLWTGDLAYKHRNGACFSVEDAQVEQPRCDAFEISPTGPIFGTRMSRPGGRADALEQEVLAESGLPPEAIQAQAGVPMQGERRPLRIPLSDERIESGGDANGPYLRVEFSLPAGSYATVVIREICKTENRPASRAVRAHVS